MIAGHLTSKNGYWYLILQTRDDHGQPKSKWIATHMKVNGNKRKSEAMLLEARRQNTSLGDIRKRTRDTLPSDYLITQSGTTPLYNLYAEETAVIRYAQQFLKYNQELGIDHAVEALAHHATQFDYADTPTLTPEAATIVLKMVCNLFPYAEKVIGNNPIEILLNEAQHESRNGESTAIFTQNGMHGSICIYQLQDDCIAAPEHILLHEMGHLLHMRATGTVTDVPANFIEYLSQLGTDCNKLSAS